MYAFDTASIGLLFFLLCWALETPVGKCWDLMQLICGWYPEVRVVSLKSVQVPTDWELTGCFCFPRPGTRTSAELSRNPQSMPAHSTMASLPSAHLSLRFKENWYFCKQLQFVALCWEQGTLDSRDIEDAQYLSKQPNQPFFQKAGLCFRSVYTIQISQAISLELAYFWRAELWRVLTTEASHRHLTAGLEQIN